LNSLGLSCYTIKIPGPSIVTRKQASDVWSAEFLNKLEQITFEGFFFMCGEMTEDWRKLHIEELHSLYSANITGG
jgi:hypothetical protein